MTPELLNLHGVSKSFANGTQALAGLELKLSRGEFVSLLGPSAAANQPLCA